MDNKAFRISTWSILGMIVLVLLDLPAAEAFLFPAMASYFVCLPGLLGWRF